MPVIQFGAKFFPEDLAARAQESLPRAADALADLKAGRCTGSEWTGWYDWPARRGRALLADITRHVSDLDYFYDTVVVVGIGGSYLGCRAVTEALSHAWGPMLGRAGRNPRRPQVVFAGHHLSEAGLVELLDLLEERQPVVNVISKSGTTTEPAVAFRVIRSYMERRFGRQEAARRIIATTDGAKGALRTLARENGYKTFEVPDDVGGRFSVLTAVGLVPLALGGFDCEKLLAGADSLFHELRDGVAQDHPVLRYAASRHAAFTAGKRIEALAFAEPRLLYLAEWWKQLFGESEGKNGKGLFPASLGYTTDLHSLGQYVQDGVRNMIETFLLIENAATAGEAAIERRLRVPHMSDNADGLGYLENRLISEINEAAMLGTKVAHFDGGVPCMSLGIQRMDEQSIGALFAFFETACAVSGLLLGVNPFDQPGVEAYKVNLFALLGKPGTETVGAELRKRLSRGS